MNNDKDGKRLFRIAMIVLTVLILSTIVLLIPSKTVYYKSIETEEIQPEKIEPTTQTLLAYISFCESRHNQFDKEGNVLRNSEGSSAVGRWQIMESWWGEEADKLGYDIYTEEGNRKMAEYILTEAQGIQAWSASAKCLEENFNYKLAVK